MKWESGLRMSRILRSDSSANPWEFITRAVPSEARRAVNRWNRLKAGRNAGQDRKAQAPEGTRPTLQLEKSGRGRELGCMEESI